MVEASIIGFVHLPESSLTSLIGCCRGDLVPGFSTSATMEDGVRSTRRDIKI